MEVLLHYIYVVALKDAKAWQGLGPGELAVVGFWNLIIVWLKVSPRSNAHILIRYGSSSVWV